MTTITLKINERTKAGKTLMSLVKFFAEEEKNSVTVENLGLKKPVAKAVAKEESPYDPKFVAMIKKTKNSGKGKIVNPSDIWGSLGLK